MPDRAQPWKAHWPPPANVQKGFEAGKKAGDQLQIDGTSGFGAFGYTDESSPVKKKQT
jgi:hypothetical protein